jgi:hypothetical protein
VPFSTLLVVVSVFCSPGLSPSFGRATVVVSATSRAVVRADRLGDRVGLGERVAQRLDVLLRDLAPVLGDLDLLVELALRVLQLLLARRARLGGDPLLQRRLLGFELRRARRTAPCISARRRCGPSPPGLLLRVRSAVASFFSTTGGGGAGGLLSGFSTETPSALSYAVFASVPSETACRPPAGPA